MDKIQDSDSCDKGSIPFKDAIIVIKSIQGYECFFCYIFSGALTPINDSASFNTI